MFKRKFGIRNIFENSYETICLCISLFISFSICKYVNNKEQYIIIVKFMYVTEKILILFSKLLYSKYKINNWNL